jgi:hypothetical protein
MHIQLAMYHNIDDKLDQFIALGPATLTKVGDGTQILKALKLAGD